MGSGARGRDESALLRLLACTVDDPSVEHVAEAMVQTMVEGVLGTEVDAEIAADALMASRQTAGEFLQSLATEPWFAPEPPPALSDLACTLARRGLDVTVLIKLARFGQTVFWPSIMEAAEEAIDDPTARVRVLITAFKRFSTYFEASLESAVTVFVEERDLRMRGAHAHRDETVRAVLAGETIDLDRASAALGYELRRWHTALALWDEASGRNALVRLEGAAREIASSLGGGRLLTTVSGAHGLWAWVATTATPSFDQFARVPDLEVPLGVRTAVGFPASGAAGFRSSHEEAIAAQRFAGLRHGERGDSWCALYEDVEIASLLYHDVAGARALVARELAGLAGTDAHSIKLRETVLAFLRRGGSATAAARDLGVHTNTVRYRIEQAVDALGRPLDGRMLRLQLALTLAAAVGPTSLP